MSSERQLHLERLISKTVAGEPARVQRLRACSGGCIHQAEIAELADGRHYFVKSSPHAADMFEQEVLGLQQMATAGCLRVPQVIARGRLGSDDCLILECIQSSQPASDFFCRLGSGLAAMHRQQQADRFGWFEDNFLGSSPQENRWASDWSEFFAKHRLGAQLRMAQQRHVGSTELFRLADRLLQRLPELLTGAESQPCLLHGDLWSGNFMPDERGLPTVFDPAAYYGDREAELAMPLLFGGFAPTFFEAYHEAWPLAAGWQDRVELYKLYHLLNHWNLFGDSYLGGCLEILRRYA